jgi:L-alanine-DL-glutamate epimerase-like enolase superfamily enzyme
MELQNTNFVKIPTRREFFRSGVGIAAGAAASLFMSQKTFADESTPQIETHRDATDVRITSVETFVLAFETKTPSRDAIHSFGDRGGVVTRIHTNIQVTGHSYTYFGTIPGGPRVVAKIINEELFDVIKAEDPFFVKRIRDKMWKATEYHGVTGVVQFGIAAVDMAVWDIIGRVLQKPLYKILGGFRDRVPAYAMVGWYYDDEEEFTKRCAAAIEEGFRAVKIKVGLGSLADDIHRIKAARKTIGDNIDLMVDANQAFTVSTALERGKAYQDLGIFWFEEPLPPHDHEGYEELGDKLSIRIATGENEYTKYAFADLIKRGGVDVVQPDNRRTGGVTEWMEIAALADAFHIQVASHGSGPGNLNMLAAMPNAIYLESSSLKGDSLYEVNLKMVDGEVLVPDVPGLGTAVRDDFIKKHRIA